MQYEYLILKATLVLWALLILFFRMPAVFSPQRAKNTWKKQMVAWSKNITTLFGVLCLIIAILLFYILIPRIQPIGLLTTVMATLMLMGFVIMTNHNLFKGTIELSLKQNNKWIRIVCLFSCILALIILWIVIKY